MNNDKLNDLEKRNEALKSKLIRQQLKYNGNPLTYYKKYSSIVLNEYRECKSLFKAASNVGLDHRIVMDWYVQGQLGNPKFRGFYLAIENFNQNPESNEDNQPSVPEIKVNNDEADELEGEYIISEYGDGWSYKTYIDGEKIFIISNELETLKKKVRDKRLPLDE